MIDGYINTDQRSNLYACLQQKSTMEFQKCLEGEKSSSFKFKQINLKSFTTGKLMAGYGIHQTLLPGDGVLGLNPISVSVSFVNTYEYKFSLYDKNFFFPTLNYLSVPRTSFRINKLTSFYMISLQVSFRKYVY